jgi:hypothetical protein
MKGVIALCAKELVVDKFGKDKWDEILKNAGLETEPLILPITNVDDNLVMEIVKSIGKVLNLSLEQVADAFGDYWVNVYSQKMYANYYKQAENAKDFLLKMDDLHTAMTKNMEGAKPPHFEYEQPADNILIMKYHSNRGLVDFVVGLAKGVAKYYGEDVEVSKEDSDKVKIVFK